MPDSASRPLEPALQGAVWHYDAFGWHIRSEIALPGLKPCAESGSPDVLISIGQVPALAEPVSNGAFLSYDRAGIARLEVRGVAAFRIQNGREIIIEPHLALDAPDIFVFLLGTVFGVLSHQRGELPLHASCVEVDGRAVVLTGPSGTGKSTLAAALGLRLLADDVSIIRRCNAGFMVMPAFPRQKLWQDTLSALGLPRGRRLRSTGQGEKFEHVVEDRFCSEPRPLALVCHLHRTRFEAVAPRPFASRFEALQALNEGVYRLPIGQALNGQRLFATVGALVSSVPQLQLSVPDDLQELAAFGGGLPDVFHQFGAF